MLFLHFGSAIPLVYAEKNLEQYYLHQQISTIFFSWIGFGMVFFFQYATAV